MIVLEEGGGSRLTHGRQRPHILVTRSFEPLLKVLIDRSQRRNKAGAKLRLWRGARSGWRGGVLKEQQLKARNVKLWITFFKSALKSERSNSGCASRCRKEAELKARESRAADSGEPSGRKRRRKTFSFFWRFSFK